MATKAIKTKKTKTEAAVGDFAVIKTGGKQYFAKEGGILKIEKLAGSFKVGDAITFDEVLMTDDGSTSIFGAPMIKGAKVTATLEEEGRDKKVTTIKYKQKSRYFKRTGHRQPYMKVKITSIK